MDEHNNIRLSLVIPVYRSEGMVGQTITETVAFCEEHFPDYEIVLVNDGSPDNSWSILEQYAHENHRIIAINLLKNYGQHIAIYCGFQHVTGDYIVTMDDDLQNPPSEIVHLYAATQNQHDVVFGEFKKKEHASHRRAGSWLVLQINRRIFGCPDDLIVSNFRLIHRDVIDRIINHRTLFPYITGLSLLYSANPANALVEHHPRRVGTSSYTLIKLVRFTLRIVFTYSSLPIWIVALTGGSVLILSVILGFVILLIWGLVGEIWTIFWFGLTIWIVSVGSVTILTLLVIIGEYIFRMLRWMTNENLYNIQQRIN